MVSNSASTNPLARMIKFASNSTLPLSPTPRPLSQATTIRSTLSRRMSVIGARISRAFTSEPSHISSSIFPMEASPDEARSRSRGRDVYQSSGRGGAGNIHRASKSRDPIRKPDEFSPTRGRELAVDSSKITSSGRGGAGNIRSPSRDLNKVVSQEEVKYEKDVLQRRAEAEKTAVYSSGRGGMGNISRSRSRGPNSGLSPPYHSTGRGGAGNIVTGNAANASALDEEERREHLHPDVTHSTGRGGAGNITHEASPGIEHHEHHHTGPESSGRGGVGNILNRSRSRSPGPNNILHSTGRGGAGNILPGDGSAAANIDYEERKLHPHKDGIHSTGRGGTGNLTNISDPAVEHHPHHANPLESSGRGGAGNIHAANDDRLSSLLAKAHIHKDHK